MSRPRRHQVLGRKQNGRAARFAIAVIVLTMPPARMGSQDLLAPAAQPAVQGVSFRAHFLASPFGTIHAATFRFSQPVGTSIPGDSGLHLAALAADGDTLLSPPPSYPHPRAGEGREEAEINRALKGPRLVPRIRPDFESPRPATIDGADLSPTAARAASDNKNPADHAEARSTSPEPDGDLIYPDPSAHETAEPWLTDGDTAALRVAHLYFATTSLGGAPAVMEPWPGEPPILEPQEMEPTSAAPNLTAPAEPQENETIAPKGEVTGEGRRPKSPAELLGLVGAARARHEKCLADAVYFEARGEPVRGQMAVAQVVINRVFSGYYPHSVCSVVYQNAHRHLRCQFTFACDGIPERISEPDAWERAKRIARDALDGNFWLNDVGKATHYHARWVHPRWVREMRRLDRIGVHTFYRPRKWGDGAGSPVPGDASAKL